ncbi:Sds3-like-domain-containing protein [Thamnocephalis sphaerospora]|uniref:Sds3-like-domain-containing protein n=1 Tax=Thamnocephalis sphaerospora TaxID=78915 RepID=A0A4P9XIF3_9FUNG|nr:Sds3-like-domain-containing protein [Thamnocephalis sphaerospora]|eukprot:RKP05475.1 Sds3-like-domain-containing protein [Thamnocephalis sphaerospora]
MNGHQEAETPLVAPPTDTNDMSTGPTLHGPSASAPSRSASMSPTASVAAAPVASTDRMSTATPSPSVAADDIEGGSGTRAASESDGRVRRRGGRGGGAVGAGHGDSRHTSPRARRQAKRRRTDAAGQESDAAARHRGSPPADQSDSEDDEQVRAMKADHRKNTQRMSSLQEAFADLKDRMYEARLYDLDNEVRQVHAGKHPAIRDRVEEAQEVRADRLGLARRRRDYAARSAISLCQADRDIADNMYAYAATQLRITMMMEIERRLQCLQAEHQEIDRGQSDGDTRLPSAATAASLQEAREARKRAHDQERAMATSSAAFSDTKSSVRATADAAAMACSSPDRLSSRPATMTPLPVRSPPIHSYSTRSRMADVGSA